MLILAGVTIATLTGDNGIITQANKTRVEQSHATVKEATTLAYNEHQIEMETVENTTTNFLDYLIGKGYVDATTKIVDEEKLIGTKQALGNGKGDNDVYKVEQEKGGYILKYYENSTEKTILWQAETFSDEEIFVYDETEEGIEIVGLDFSKLEYEYEKSGYGIYAADEHPITAIKIKNMETLKIPSTINGKNVISVCFLANRSVDYHHGGYNDFEASVTGIEKIVYPETVRNIGAGTNNSYISIAMTSVKSIELPEGLEKISCLAYNSPFRGMTELEEITIPSSVKIIDSSAFYGTRRNHGVMKELVINIKGKNSGADFEEPIGETFLTNSVDGNPVFYATVNYLGK